MKKINLAKELLASGIAPYISADAYNAAKKVIPQTAKQPNAV